MEQIKSLSDLQSLFKRQVANKHISTCPYGGPQPYLKRYIEDWYADKAEKLK